MKVLVLADFLYPASSSGPQTRRHCNDLQWGASLPLKRAVAAIPHPPHLGATLIATIIRDAGFEVELIECAFQPLQRRSLLAALESAPRAVCISTTYINDDNSIEKCVRLVRQYCPTATIIVGGPGIASTRTAHSLADFCVLGDGEEAIVPLLKNVESGGVKTMDGPHVISSSPKQIFESTDTLPDWSLCQRNSEEFFPLETQRGCRFRCTFCSYPGVSGYQLRQRPLKSVLNEVICNFQKHGIWRYTFADSTFTDPPKRCIELLNALSGLPFRIEWIAYARADTITEEMATAMAKSGCVGLYFGIESGSETILQSMRKGFRLDEVREAIRLVRAAGIRSTGSWMVGWPGETPETVKETVDFASELRCDQNSVYTFAMASGSSADNDPERFGIERNDLGWKHPTMNSVEAEEWTDWVLQEMLNRGLLLGSTFNFAHLASAGLGINDSLELMREAQNHYMNTHSDSRANWLLKKSAEILAASRRHPVYAHNDKESTAAHG